MEIKKEYSRKLMRFGILLLMLGLLTGFAIPMLANPRMGLSSHLEGTFNGMLLVIFGLIWPQLRLSAAALKWGFGLALFGSYTNWLTTLLAAAWAAGGEMMPIAGGNLAGSAFQEGLIKFGLLSLSVSMLAVCVILLRGLRGKAVEVV